MISIQFTVPGIPHGKDRPRFRVAGGHVITYTTQATKDYEAAVLQAYREAANGRPPMPKTVAVSVALTAVFPIPQSTPKRARAQLEGQPHKHRPDTDNVLKSILDGLNGAAFEDDSQVTEVWAEKRYAKSGEEPHVDVVITEVDSD